MNNQNFTPSENPEANAKRVAFLQYRNCRLQILIMLVLTAINILLIAVQASISFPFSAGFPQFLAEIGLVLYVETGAVLPLIICSVAGVLSLLPYFLAWKFSERRYGWMIAALVLFSLDSLFFLLFSFTLVSIIETLFHVWVLFYLVRGVKYGPAAIAFQKELESAPAETQKTQEAQSTEQNNIWNDQNNPWNPNNDR